MRDTRVVRATGLQGDTSPEIIEILDDDINAFSDRASASGGRYAGNDTGGPRWIGPAAAAALLALIGFGVATSASSTSLPRASKPTPTTAAPVRPTPTTTTPANTPVVQYYAADPPRQFSVHGADLQVLDHSPYNGLEFQLYQLWATPGSSAAAGSWFSISATRGTSIVTAPDAYRIQPGQQSLAISHTPGGQTITKFSAGEPVIVTITSFGWSDADLARLAASVQTDGRSVDFSDAWFTADHRLVSSVLPMLAVQSVPAEQLTYTATDDPDANLVVTVAQRLQPDQGGATIDRDNALRFLLSDTTPFPVDGHAAVAGTMVGSGGRTIAAWIAGNDVVTVTSSLPLAQLVEIAQTVHAITPAEWEGVKFQAVHNNSNHARSEESIALQVAAGADPDLQQWTVAATMTHPGRREKISWSWPTGGITTTSGAAAQISTAVDGERTYVVADLPRAVAPGGELHVLRDGLETVVVPFNDVDPQLDRTLAAFAFSEPVPFTVQIVSTVDGSVLASWPAT